MAKGKRLKANGKKQKEKGIKFLAAQGWILVLKIAGAGACGRHPD